VHIVRGESSLAAFDRGGLEVLTATTKEFAVRIQAENRTLKRALTDPTIFSGIGNAYSDEILFVSKLSPVKRTAQLTPEEIDRLHAACQATLSEWVERLRGDVGDGFPEKVTAFREEMFVHGRYKEPCRVCGTKVRRIRYEANEVNYCPRCQTGGKVLADRSLSRLLKGDWPKSIEELEELELRRSRDHEI
jgi:formamidopyrimidine-DNA glycosylase